jgi:hypothetical protein
MIHSSMMPTGCHLLTGFHGVNSLPLLLARRYPTIRPGSLSQRDT